MSEPSATTCTTCGSTGLRGVRAAGGATLVSWAGSHGRAARGEPAPRTVLVIAAFDEGPWWWAQLDDDLPGAVADDGQDELTVGQRLRVEFRRPGGEPGRQPGGEPGGEHRDVREAVPVFVRA